MVTSTEDTSRTKGNKASASKTITVSARGQTCVDAKQYQRRSEESILIKVKDADFRYSLTCLTCLSTVITVKYDSVIKNNYCYDM